MVKLRNTRKLNHRKRWSVWQFAVQNKAGLGLFHKKWQRFFTALWAAFLCAVMLYRGAGCGLQRQDCGRQEVQKR